MSVSAPKSVARNQDVRVKYKVAGLDKSDSDSLTVTATVPAGMQLVRTEPRAVVDEDQLIWTLPAGKAQSVEAVYRPLKSGEYRFVAGARTGDDITSRASASVSVSEAKLLLRLDGPKTALVGAPVSFQATVTNAGDAPAERVRVQARLGEGLDAAKSSPLDQTIPSLPAGQSKSITFPVVATKGGKLAFQAEATAEGGLVAAPQLASVEVDDVQLSLSAHGPVRGYVGQEVTWNLIVQNPGKVPLENVVVRASLPAEVRFVKASDGGRVMGRNVVWDLGTAPAQREWPLTVTGVCDRLSA